MKTAWMGLGMIAASFAINAGCAADVGTDESSADEAAAPAGGAAEHVGHAEGALVIGVDPALQPDVPELIYKPGTPGRPVVAVMDMNGARADMVENEVIVTSDDVNAVTAFFAKYNGVVTQVAVPSGKTPEQPAPGAPAYRTQYLVRVDPAKGNIAKLESDLRILLKNQSYTLSFGVSTQGGLGTMAIAADAVVHGKLDAGLNWVARGATIPNGSTAEAPVTASWTPPGGYTSDAFQWSIHNGGRGPLAASGLNTGVAQAWRMMDLAGRRPTQTRIGILDQGFAPNADFGTFTSFSNIPFRDALNQTNVNGCGPGNPCLWHGTGVAQTAYGTPDNGFGAAGAAGPYANAVLASTWYDFFTTIFAMNGAVDRGARVLSMSFGAQIPWPLAWSGIPYNATAAALRARGILLFASAGNNGIDVDGGCLFGECDWILPCEADGVLCVGATNPSGAPTRAGYSAFGSNTSGSQTVDLWAPGTTFVGPDPQSPFGNMVQTFSGTSAAAPFAAGVAALTWAANSSLSANQVETFLLLTARPSPADTTVRRFINAYDAVLAVLGPGHTTANACAHPLCNTGAALGSGCDMPLNMPPAIAVPTGAVSCVQHICAVDPFCCNNSWDAICKGEVSTVCGVSCN